MMSAPTMASSASTSTPPAREQSSRHTDERATAPRTPVASHRPSRGLWQQRNPAKNIAADTASKRCPICAWDLPHPTSSRLDRRWAPRVPVAVAIPCESPRLLPWRRRPSTAVSWYSHAEIGASGGLPRRGSHACALVQRALRCRTLVRPVTGDLASLDCRFTHASAASVTIRASFNLT